jgi:putative PEP-CTERM system histidine kinase
VTLEQVARNTRRDHQWNVKLLIIGLALPFAYGFVQNAETLLFRSRSLTLLVPQGYIYAAATPFIAIAALRNREHRMNLNLSRSFVFRTGTLVLAGVYLLIMGTAGYYVRFFGGEWGAVFEVFLVTAALLTLVLLAASSQVRNWLRVAIVRNLYEYKYDYREEWLRVTGQLTEASPDAGLAERAMRTLTDLLYANAAGYFRMSDAGVLLPEAQIGARWSTPMTPENSKSLHDFFSARGWVIDLDEWRESTAAYPGLRLRADVEQWAGVRFIVPLLLERHLFGVILIGEPAVSIKLIWEDYDILKVIARQAAAFLALHHADQVLAESRQLRAMDQLSAFVVHDLKTITAQFSLLLKNAERHKQNPAFIDDMLRTTGHAVTQMTKLLNQLRARDNDSVGSVDLVEVVRAVAIERGRYAPTPSTRIETDAVVVHGDAVRLGSVVGHIVQNAQEASGENGTVCIGIHATPNWAVLEVSDSGHGMTPEFVQSELFKPFATTKGVAGIGVGAFQCREYLRQLGGDVSVQSQPGVGTTFTLRIPLPQRVEVPA